jgi:hypothetical protein
MRIAFILLVLMFQSAASQAQERQWRLDASEKDAFLVFGVPDTDDAGLGFWCKIGSGTVNIFSPFDRKLIQKNQLAQVDLEIGDQKFKIKMKASPDPNSKNGSLEGPVSVSGTVMQAVAGATVFSITAFGRRESYPLIDADVSGLLNVCSGHISN